MTFNFPAFKFNQTKFIFFQFCLVDTRPQNELEQKKADARKRKYEERQKIRQLKQQDSKNSDGAGPSQPKDRKIDIPAGGICITGSCNWTMQGFAGNWENIIITSDPAIVKPFRREFDRIHADFLEAQGRNGEAVSYT